MTTYLDQETFVATKRPRRSMLRTVLIFLGGLVAGLALTLVYQRVTRPPETFLQKWAIDFDPYLQASVVVGEDPNVVAAYCNRTSQNLKAKGILCHPATVALVIGAAGRANVRRNKNLTDIDKAGRQVERWLIDGEDPCHIIRFCGD